METLKKASAPRILFFSLLTVLFEMIWGCRVDQRVSGNYLMLSR